MLTYGERIIGASGRPTGCNTCQHDKTETVTSSCLQLCTPMQRQTHSRDIAHSTLHTIRLLPFRYKGPSVEQYQLPVRLPMSTVSMSIQSQSRRRQGYKHLHQELSSYGSILQITTGGYIPCSNNHNCKEIAEHLRVHGNRSSSMSMRWHAKPMRPCKRLRLQGCRSNRTGLEQIRAWHVRVRRAFLALLRLSRPSWQLRLLALRSTYSQNKQASTPNVYLIMQECQRHLDCVRYGPKFTYHAI